MKTQRELTEVEVVLRRRRYYGAIDRIEALRLKHPHLDKKLDLIIGRLIRKEFEILKSLIVRYMTGLGERLNISDTIILILFRKVIDEEEQRILLELRNTCEKKLQEVKKDMKSIKDLTMEQLIEKVNKYTRVLDCLETIHLATEELEVKVLSSMERVFKMELECEQQLTNLISEDLKNGKGMPGESIIAFFKEPPEIEENLVKLLTGLRDKYSTVEGK